ncbi:MAG: DegV family protein [Lachnospiraceae bacterium]|nr:DegV family protein [Lachnospiraceae bacterium]
MSYKIVVDSCCELPEKYKNDKRFQIVPLELEVGDYRIWDDENFDQKDFIRRIAESPKCPKTACPSPQKYMEAYDSDANHVYVVTLSGKLSGSHNSAVVGKDMYEEEYGRKPIYVCDSESASIGETQIALMAMKLEEMGLTFAQIVTRLEEFRDKMHTYFVLDNLETLRKNGRLTGVKALVASTLSIKPIMAGKKGSIVQIGQAVGIKKALARMVDNIIADIPNPEERTVMISHVNCFERAQLVKDMLLKKAKFAAIEIFDTAGVSTVYANDGGIIVTV